MTIHYLCKCSRQADLQVTPDTVLISQETVMNEVGYQLEATFEWVHLGVQAKVRMGS
jgi:hypothetical protein